MPERKQLPEVSPRFSPYLKRWPDLQLREKHREIVRCAQRHNGHAVTLNLSPAYAQSLLGHANPMRKISKRFNAELVTLDLRELRAFLMLEATRDTARPHLHGVVIVGSVSMSTIQHMFRNAVGLINGRSGSRQFKAKKLYASDGWVNYVYKDTSHTRRLLELCEDTRLCWVSRSMTQFVRSEYDAVRLAKVSAANPGSSPASLGA